MHSPAVPSPVATGSRWGRWVLLAMVVLLIIGLVLTGVAYFRGYAMARNWAQSPKGQRVASRAVSHAIKVDGTFAPLHVTGWTVQTDSFQGPGWPGEALGSFEAHNIRATFDPSAVFHHAWRISGIEVDRATISLLPPNDKLKRPPEPKKPKRWYAFLLPDHFECGPIVAQNAALEFAFQKQKARIHDAHVQADLIGKDLKYTATSGVMEFPYLPPLKVNRLEMLVTKPMITVYTAQLAGLEANDPARVTLSGKIGMREDKSIDAHVEVVQMPIDQILPEDLNKLIHGRASGKLVWTRDATGRQVNSEGDLTLTGAQIDDLSVFRQLALLHDNPDLKDFAFDQATLHFVLRDGLCTVDLRARAPEKFAFVGRVTYQLATKMATVDATFSDLPLATWLPRNLKDEASGVAHATMKWSGKLDTIKGSAGQVALNLDGAQMKTPAVLREVLAKKHFRAPGKIQFQTAELNVNYADETFNLTRGDLALPGILNAQISGKLAAGSQLDAIVDWQGLTIQDWLPEELAQQFSGDINGHAVVRMQSWKMAEGSYAGTVKLLHGELSYTSVQSMLARFVDDRRLLEIPLTRATFAWTWKNGDLRVSDIDLRGRDDLGVSGYLHVTRDRQLSGLLWVGTKPVYLRALGSAAPGVFVRRQDGLVWAKANVSGTSKKPQQDLTAQVVAQLKRHPLVILGLSVKLASWYAGNLLGAQDDWKRPEAAR